MYKQNKSVIAPILNKSFSLQYDFKCEFKVFVKHFFKFTISNHFNGKLTGRKQVKLIETIIWHTNYHKKFN